MYWLFKKFVLFILGFKYKIIYEGVENCPKDGGFIYASNHRSYFDPVLITLAVSKRFAYMAKEELFHKNIFFTALIKLFGAFPVSRGKGDNGVIEIATEKLQKGRNLIIFPEGTRSYDGKVGRGKSGVALIAAKAGVGVIPVGIIFKGTKIKKGDTLIVKYGKQIIAEELTINSDSHSELKNIKSKIMDAITLLVEGETTDE